MIRYNTPLDNLRLGQVREISDLTLSWCIAMFGVNNRKRKPLTLCVEFTHVDGDAYGMYVSEDNRIFIYLSHVKNIKSLVSTIIHEYIHTLQPIGSKYTELMKQYKYYSRHPYERQAIYYEKKYAKVCWDGISSAVPK